MTVENILQLLAANPPPPLGQKLTIEQHHVVTAHLQPSSASARIPIPGTKQRTRHQSWGSTGSSMGSGKSSPLSGSPPLHDLAFPVHGFPFPPPLPLSTSTSQSQKIERQSIESQSQSHKNVNPTRYKTEMCRPFEESGHCKYGDKCQFAHGRYELRNLSRHPKYKTELCRTFHTVGFCPYGPRCHFVHNEDDLKLSEINQMKHQQVINQVVQHVAQQQQQVLSRMTITHAIPMPRPPVAPDMRNLPMPVLMSLGSTVDSPPASVDSGSPTPCDDVFSPPATPDAPRSQCSGSRASTPANSYNEPPTNTVSPSSSPTRLPIFSRFALQ